MNDFDAQVDAWVKKSTVRMEAVFKTAAQALIVDMQSPVTRGGNMPVDTGFLRASLKTTLNAPALDFKANPGTGLFDWGASEAALTINGAKLGDTVYAVYTANYARHVEYGTSSRSGRRFVGQAVDKWQKRVDEAARDARARGGAL